MCIRDSSYTVTPNDGFSINGVPTPLRGVARHQDRLYKGNALTLSLIHIYRKLRQTERDLQKKTPKQVHLCQKCGILTMYF